METLCRLIRSTVGVAAQRGKKVVFQIPAGSEIIVPDLSSTSPNDEVIVHWNGKAVLVFVSDLQVRATPMEAAEAAVLMARMAEAS